MRVAGKVQEKTGMYSPKLTVTDELDDSASANATVNVDKEDAAVQYSGDTIAGTGTNLTLEATVRDSAAQGYEGPNPESGADATIGDITKMSLRFDIYQGTTCGSGTPLKSYTQQVADSGSSADGIGTASKPVNQKTDLGSSNEQTYCVVVEVVNNPYYKAERGQPATATFYQNVGQFVTGGGWIADPNGSRGNFGFNVRYNPKGQPQGQIVYVYRGDYQGEGADFVIKSNALSQLSFSGATHPMRATLSGKGTIQINRSSDGAGLFSEGNATFTATASDTNQSSGIGYDSYSLVAKRSSGAEYHSVPDTLLKGGNIVARPK